MTPLLHDNFAEKTPGPLSSADTGQSYTANTSAGANSVIDTAHRAQIIPGGGLTFTDPGVGASYTSLDLGAGNSVVEMGAVFTLSSGSTNSGGIVLCAFSAERTTDMAIATLTARLHFSVTQHQALLSVVDPAASPKIFPLWGFNYTSDLTANDQTQYRASVAVSGNDAYVRAPGLDPVKVTDSRISGSGRWATFECIRNLSTDGRGRFIEIWADKVPIATSPPVHT